MPSLGDYVERLTPPTGWDEQKSLGFRKKFYRFFNPNTVPKLFPFVDTNKSPEDQRKEAGKILRILGISRFYYDSTTSSPTTVAAVPLPDPLTVNPLLTLDYSHQTFQNNEYDVEKYWSIGDATGKDILLQKIAKEHFENQKPIDIHVKIHSQLKAFLEALKQRSDAHRESMEDQINMELQSYMKGERVLQQYVSGIHTFNSLKQSVQQDVIQGRRISLADFNKAFEMRILSLAYKEWKVFASDIYHEYKHYMSKLIGIALDSTQRQKAQRQAQQQAAAAQAQQQAAAAASSNNNSLVINVPSGSDTDSDSETDFETPRSGDSPVNSPQTSAATPAAPQASASAPAAPAASAGSTTDPKKDPITHDKNGNPVMLNTPDGRLQADKNRLKNAANGLSWGKDGYNKLQIVEYLNAQEVTFAANADKGALIQILKSYLEGVEKGAATLSPTSAAVLQARSSFLDFSDVEMDELEYEYEPVSDKELDDILKEAEKVTYDSSSDMDQAYDSDSLAAKSYDSSSDSSAQAKSYDSSSDSSMQAKSYDSSSDSSQAANSYDSSSDMEI